MVGSLDDAPGLPERARFVLWHCREPMRFLGSIAALTEDATGMTTRCSYRCDLCGSNLEVALTEPR
jgi:hypothetical protein